MSAISLFLLVWATTTTTTTMIVKADTAPVGLECDLCGPNRVLRSPLPTGGHYCDDLHLKGHNGLLTFEECATSQTELPDFCCTTTTANDGAGTSGEDPPEDDPLPAPKHDVCNICNVGDISTNGLLQANPSFECEMDYLRGMAGLLDLDECMDRQYDSIAEQCCQSNGVAGGGAGDRDSNGDDKDNNDGNSGGGVPPPNMMYPVCQICGTYSLQDPLTSECGEYRRQGLEGKITPQKCEDYRPMLVGECCVVPDDSEDDIKDLNAESNKSSEEKKKPTLQRALFPVLALVALAAVVIAIVLRRGGGMNQKEITLHDDTKGGEVELGRTSSSTDGSNSDEERGHHNKVVVDVGDEHKVVV